MRGIYVSYNEDKVCCTTHNIEYGSVYDLIKISKNSYLIFENKKACKKRDLRFPTKVLLIIVPKKEKGEYECYKGDLLLVIDYLNLNPKIFEDPKHRPENWIKMYQQCEKEKGEAKSVFFISNLEPTIEPPNLKGKHSPQTFKYENFDWG